MAEDHVLRIVVDPAAARTGAREVESALRNVTQQAQKAEASVNRLATANRSLAAEQRKAALAAHDAREAAKASLQAFEQQYQLDIARIKEGQARGFISPKEAAQAGREAAQAYNTAIVAELDKGARTGAFRGRAGREAFTEVAGSLKNVSEAGRSANLGLHRLNNSMIVVTRQALGAHPVIGQVADAVGTFAIGTARMIPILAGLAAIAFAYNRITKNARETKKAAEDAAKAIREQAREEASRGQATKIDQITALRRREDQLRGRIAAAEERVGRALAGSGLTDIQQRGAQARVDALRKEYDELRKVIQQGEAQLAAMRTEAFETQLRALAEQTVRLKEGERAAFSYALSLDASLSPAQRATLQAIYDTNRALDDQKKAAERSRSAFESWSEKLKKERDDLLINNELRSDGADAAYRLSLALTDDLTPAMREQLIAMREQNKEIERQILLTGRLNPRLAAGGSLRTVGAIGSGRPAWAYEGSILRRAAEEGQAALESEQVWARAMENIQDVFADGFEDIFRDGLDGFKSMADAIGKIFGGLGRQIAAALAIEKLGIDDIVKTIREKGIDGLSTKQKIGGSALAGFGVGYSSGNAGAGVFGGLLSGAATGNPFAALAGAAAGLAGGLLGSAQRTREAQRIFTESLNNVRESLEDIRDAAAGISDPMKGLRDDINDAFDTIRKAVGERFGTHFGDRQLRTPQDIQDYIDALSRIPASLRPRGVNEFIRELENLHDTFADSAKLLEGSYRESLQDRWDALTGNDAAVLLRKQQKEREEAIRAGFDASTLALLDQVHEQERLKQATEATSAAIRDMTSALNSPSGLRLSLHRWRATEFDPRDPETFPQTPPSGVRPGYPVTMPPPEPPSTTGRHPEPTAVYYVSFEPGSVVQRENEDGDVFVDRVVQSMERKQRRGGPVVVNRISSR